MPIPVKTVGVLVVTKGQAKSSKKLRHQLILDLDSSPFTNKVILMNGHAAFEYGTATLSK